MKELHHHSHFAATIVDETQIAGPKLARFGKGTAAGYSFGLETKAVVDHLRALADGIESGTVALQSASEANTAAIQDFQMVSLTVAYAARFPQTEGENV